MLQVDCSILPAFTEHIDTPIVDNPVEIGLGRIQRLSTLRLFPISYECPLDDILNGIGIAQVPRRIQTERAVVEAEEGIDGCLFQREDCILKTKMRKKGKRCVFL